MGYAHSSREEDDVQSIAAAAASQSAQRVVERAMSTGVRIFMLLFCLPVVGPRPIF